ncbi:hypothetical protein BCR35DRAFT_322448 [Leucosporidium creatinivorum]|uniref:Dimethylaniline monooxygenase n=1 Tax=Leucosporidium creatinivorum TaxID=106004 RepID=A0A1Y2DUC6_9BASI|nr:hypothetical protein BCR35DRAFT_322448 [Leucosporidium creatinivorum]
MPTRRSLIIGAGPSGLVSLKTLLHFPRNQHDDGPQFDPLIIEAADAIGGTFDQRSYENGNLVSSKQITAFSDYRLPASAPDHLTMPAYVDYLHGYIQRFGLDSPVGERWEGTPLEGSSRIQLGLRVVGVRKEGREHRVKVLGRDGRIFILYVDTITICTGLHVTPSVPSIAGLPENLVPQSPPILPPSTSSSSSSSATKVDHPASSPSFITPEPASPTHKSFTDALHSTSPSPSSPSPSLLSTHTPASGSIFKEDLTFEHPSSPSSFSHSLKRSPSSSSTAGRSHKRSSSMASIPPVSSFKEQHRHSSMTADLHHHAAEEEKEKEQEEGEPQYPPVEDWARELQKEGVRVIHSSQYKRRSEFEGRRVLILGIGETSMDLSYEAIQGGAKEVVVCHRGGFLSFPKVLNDFQVFGVRFDGDLPIDGLITNLFETTYVHPWVSHSHLRWFISDFIIKRVLWFLTGTQAGCNQWIGGLPPSRLGRAYVFLNKSSKAMPYINAPYQPTNRLLSTLLSTSYIDPPLPPTRCSTIDLALWPSSISTTGSIVFTPSSSLPQSRGKDRPEERRMKSREVKPDLVVFATGYRQEWGWLGEEYPQGPGDERVDVREVCGREDLSVGWVGFVRPGVGAIPPIAEQQAMLWALLVTKKVEIPTSEPYYRLLASEGARIQYGVDHSAYMSTLAKDMGAAPGLRQLYDEYGLHVLVCYCFGAAFGPFYRLVGPLRGNHEEMKDIVTTELWETVTRRGLAGNFFMGVIPMLFYAQIILIAYLLEAVWILLGRPGRRGPRRCG